MRHNDNSLDRLDKYIERLDHELTPDTPEARQALMDKILSNLIEKDGVSLTSNDTNKCKLYVEGVISMRELLEQIYKL